MRVVFLISSMGLGGAERVCSILVNGWVKLGYDVLLVTTYSGYSKSYYSIDGGATVINLFELQYAQKYGGNYFGRLLKLRSIITEFQPDVVVSFLPNVNIAAILATAFTGIPCIVSERSDPEMQPIGRIWSMACRWLYRFADAVTVQTESVAQRIGDIYPRIRHVSVMPNPLPPELVNITPLSPSSSLAKKRRTLLFVGRLSAEKRVDLIIESFAQIAQQHPDWDLHILGDGTMWEILQNCINDSELNMGRVRLLGQSNNPWKVMLESDAFVMASAYEGFPNALLEAVALGLPSVSTDCRSGPREIGNDGESVLLVPNDDKQALVSALDQLLGDATLRARLSQQGAEFVRAQFCLEHVLARWDDLFVRVCDRKGSRQSLA